MKVWNWSVNQGVVGSSPTAGAMKKTFIQGYNCLSFQRILVEELKWLFILHGVHCG